MNLQAHMIQPGDMVDLEGDPFADPHNADPFLRCELARTVRVRDFGAHQAIDFEGVGPVLFPTDHTLRVKGHCAA